MILEDREARYYKQLELSKKFKKPIVVVRVNYPGTKDNYIVNSVLDFLEIELTYLYKEVINASEGPVHIYVVDEDAFKLKETGILLENGPLGRLVDFDVYDETFKQIARSDLGIKPRKCVVCGSVAHECIRSMKHSLEETLQNFNEIFINGVAEILSKYVKESLQEELDLHPKPGLITPHSNGAHKDMDYELMNKSIRALDFTDFVKASFTSYSEAKKEGVLLEKRMFEATRGVNTHKGAIFLLGSIIYGLVDSLKNNITLEESLKTINEGVTQLLENPNYNSHGKNVYETYGIKGILGDAEEGFPLLFKYQHLDGEQLLRALMRECVDSTIIHRHDYETLLKVQELSNEKSFEELDKMFIKDNISPGGSADLYAGVKLLRRVNQVTK